MYIVLRLHWKTLFTCITQQSVRYIKLSTGTENKDYIIFIFYYKS